MAVTKDWVMVPLMNPCSAPILTFVKTPVDYGGWLNGPSIDSGHARLQHAFWCEHMDEVFSLERGAQEYDIMLSGRARFGAVLLCIFGHCQGACC
jgi:hypothetical protein